MLRNFVPYLLREKFSRELSSRADSPKLCLGPESDKFLLAGNLLRALDSRSV